MFEKNNELRAKNKSTDFSWLWKEDNWVFIEAEMYL